VDIHETAAGIPRVVELLKDARMDQ
jgi:hypothetical protein